MTKTCTQCCKPKRLSDFYPRARKCKVCTRLGVRRNWKAVMADPTRRAHARQMARDKVARYRKLGLVASNGSGSAEAKRRWRKQNKPKVNAHTKARRAEKRGLLQSPSACQRCGKVSKLQKHHADYSRPLDVIWLCTSCHGVEHRKK